MDAETYLQRIAYRGPRQPSAITLKQLHRAHMYSVPFENLDIPLNRPIVLSLPVLFEKIVVHRRGGFCYELNALFGWLLGELGFQVDILSAQVIIAGRAKPEFDHMLLLVGADEQLVADVGFGDSFIDPLQLGHKEHAQYGRCYRFIEDRDNWLLQRKTPESDWQPQYKFSLTPRKIDDFYAMCRYQQTSPDSVFTQKSTCSMPTRNGRITLSNGRLIITTEGQSQDQNIESADEYRLLLMKHFGMDLDEGADLEFLANPNISND